MIPGCFPITVVQTVPVGCISRSRGQKLGFQNAFFKNLLVLKYKAQSSHIWCLTWSRGHLPIFGGQHYWFSVNGSTVTFDLFLRWATQGPLGPLILYIVLQKVFLMLGFNQMLLDILLFIIKTSMLMTVGQILNLTKENNTKYICNHCFKFCIIMAIHRIRFKYKQGKNSPNKNNKNTKIKITKHVWINRYCFDFAFINHLIDIVQILPKQLVLQIKSTIVSPFKYCKP